MKSCQPCNPCGAEMYNMCLQAELPDTYAKFCEELASRPRYVKKVHRTQDY